MQPRIDALGDDLRHRRRNIVVEEFVFRLVRKRRIGEFDANNGIEPFADIFTRNRTFEILHERLLLLCILVDDARECRFERRFVRAAVAVADVIRKAKQYFLICIRPLQSQFDRNAFFFERLDDVDWRGVNRFFVCRQKFDIATKPTFEVEDLLFLVAALVVEDDLDARIEIRKLAQSLAQQIEIVVGDREDRIVGHPMNRRARLIGWAFVAQGKQGLPLFVFLVIVAPIAEDIEVEMFAQCVDARDSDAVKTARNLIRIVVEFAAGMQNSHDDFGRRNAFFLMDFGWDTAPIVAHRDAVIFVDIDDDFVTKPSQRLVDSIVDDFVDELMQPRNIVDIADVHARALAHCLEPFQDLDRVGRILPRTIVLVQIMRQMKFIRHSITRSFLQNTCA